MRLLFCGLLLCAACALAPGMRMDEGARVGIGKQRIFSRALLLELLQEGRRDRLYLVRRVLLAAAVLGGALVHAHAGRERAGGTEQKSAEQKPHAPLQKAFSISSTPRSMSDVARSNAARPCW